MIFFFNSCCGHKFISISLSNSMEDFILSSIEFSRTASVLLWNFYILIKNEKSRGIKSISVTEEQTGI